jgi:hypothetical protein
VPHETRNHPSLAAASPTAAASSRSYAPCCDHRHWIHRRQGTFPIAERTNACGLQILDGWPVLFAHELRGTGPHNMDGWYTAIVHAHPCGARFGLGSDEYLERPCRGCGRIMNIRRRSRRTHCSSPCRQADYRRRSALAAAALTDGRVVYRDELYWLTRNPIPAGDATQRSKGSGTV